DSAIPFRARYQRHDDLLALSELLIVDDTHLRSLAGVLRRLRTETRKLPGTDAWRASLLARLPAEGAGLSLAQVAALDDPALFGLVARQCRVLRETALRLADDISHYYFSLPGGQDEAQRV
ncbi:MAG: alpha-E domain-containing protein, partial [Rubrivivax sp.]